MRLTTEYKSRLQAQHYPHRDAALFWFSFEVHMDGIDVFKKVLTDSRFWAALWVFAQIPLSALVKDSELGQQMLAGANAFFAVLMAIIFGVSKSASVSKEVVASERNLLKWELQDDNQLTDKGVEKLLKGLKGEDV